MPAPNVDSCVVRFNIKPETPNVCDEKYFFRVVRGMFSQRRKSLVNCVSSSMALPKEAVLKAIEATGLEANVRPEALTMEQIVDFANELYKTNP